jgi:UDP-glucose 4-epimerase
MRVFVTGGAGFIGSIATFLLAESGLDVVAFDNLSSGQKSMVDSRATFLEGDLLDVSALKKGIMGCDVVLHFAAKAIVSESINYPDLYQRNNVMGTENLLKVMNDTGIKRLIFSSSCAVYGEGNGAPFLENDVLTPVNPYGASKLQCELMIKDCVDAGLLNAVIFRYFNVVGGIQGTKFYLKENHYPETHLVPNLLRATTDSPVTIFGSDFPTRDGTAIRDYVHVVDLVNAQILAINNWPTATLKTYNIGLGSGYTVLEVLDACQKVLGKSIPHITKPKRAGDPAYLLASVDRVRRDLGWHPKHSLDSMIRDTLRGN